MISLHLLHKKYIKFHQYVLASHIAFSSWSSSSVVWLWRLRDLLGWPPLSGARKAQAWCPQHRGQVWDSAILRMFVMIKCKMLSDGVLRVQRADNTGKMQQFCGKRFAPIYPIAFYFSCFPPVYPMVAVQNFPQENLVLTFDLFTLLPFNLQS